MVLQIPNKISPHRNRNRNRNQQAKKKFRGKFLVLPRAEQHSKQNQNRMMGSA
jgi:hypothetical protein